MVRRFTPVLHRVHTSRHPGDSPVDDMVRKLTGGETVPLGKKDTDYELFEVGDKQVDLEKDTMLDESLKRLDEGIEDAFD